MKTPASLNHKRTHGAQRNSPALALRSLAGIFVCALATLCPLSAQADNLNVLYSPASSGGTGVSENGFVVVGGARFGAFQEAFRGVGGFATNLGHFAGGTDSFAHAVSSDGNTIVGQSTSTGGLNRAFRWTAATGMVDLGSGSSFGISNNASVVVGESVFSNKLRAFRWTATTGMANLGALDGNSSRALALSPDGNVVVGRSSNGTYLLNGWLPVTSTQAFRWTASGMVGLGTLGAMTDGSNFSAASGVSDDGSVVVGSSTAAGANQRAFRWTSSAGMTDIGTLGTHSYADDVSGDGAFIVGSSELSANNSRAFLWDAVYGMRDLGSLLTANGVNLQGATILSAADISGGGLHYHVAGTLNRNGSSQAFIATLDAVNIYKFSTDRTVSVSFGGNVPVSVTGGAVVSLSGSNSYTGGTLILDGSLNISSAQNVGTGVVQIGRGTLNTTASTDFGSRDFFVSHAAAGINSNEFQSTIGGYVFGAGTLNKTGDGTLVLTGDSVQSGGVVIHDGAVQIGNGSTTGSVAGNIVDNSQLTFNRSNNLTFSGIISGTGDVTKLGAGILTFTNINTYTGQTFVNAGTLTVDGAVSGAGGLVTVANGATLNGSGFLNRNVTVSSGGSLAASLVITGQVTVSNQQSAGAVTSGTTTAAAGQQVNVTTASGGTVDASAGTAQVSTLNGSTLNTGNWGATVTNLTSGTVNTSGGSLVAQQGNFTGTITGSGGLSKASTGTLVLNNANSYSGGTVVGGGTLEVAAAGATGSANSIRLVNDGRLRANSNVVISGNIVAENVAATYEKVFGISENLSNFGSFQSNLGGLNTTATIASGSAGNGTTVTTRFTSGATGGFGFLASDRLTINGLDGTTFALVIDGNYDIPINANPTQIFLAWFDPSDSTFKNSVLGNHGAAGSLAGAHSMSYANFLSTNGGWNPGTMLGAYGVDVANNKVWAVIDHNSEFAAVPEPSTYAHLALGALAIFSAMRRRARLRR